MMMTPHMVWPMVQPGTVKQTAASSPPVMMSCSSLSRMAVIPANISLKCSGRYPTIFDLWNGSTRANILADGHHVGGEGEQVGVLGLVPDVEADTWLLLYSSLLFSMMKPLLWKASKQT